MSRESAATSSVAGPFGPRDTREPKPLLPRRSAKERDKLRVDARALDERMRPALKEGSEKLLLQAELSYMRHQLSTDRRHLDVTYAVNPPYAFVQVRFEPVQGEFLYIVLEPRLRAGEEPAVAEIRRRMETIMANEELPVGSGQRLDESVQLREYLKRRFDEVLDLYGIQVPERRRPILLYYLQREFVGLGRTDAILRDPFLEDISCLGPGVPLYIYHRVFGSVRTNVAYENDLELNKYIFRLAQIAGKHISIYQPILDATLQDGSRINLTLGTEVTRKGSTFSVRKFATDPVSPIDLLRFGTVSTSQLAYLWSLVEQHRSVLISGGTAAGKTTLLNAICMFVRPEDKIVSIEDTPEIQIDHQNWIQSIARTGYGSTGGSSGASGVSGISAAALKPAGSVTLFDLLVAALRQRPEYVIVGEVRGAEAFTLFQAISVGHASMSTIHAGSISELIHRVENEPMNIPRVLFRALDAVVFPTQVAVKGARARRVTGIIEILDVDAKTNELLTNEVFRWQPAEDTFLYLGRSFVLETIGRRTGQNLDSLTAELRRKQTYLGLMDRANLSHYKDVSRAIADYYIDPAEAIVRLEKRTKG